MGPIRTEPGWSRTDRIVQQILVAAAFLFILGMTIYLAPLAFEQGWWSGRGIRFILSTIAALGIAGFAARRAFSRPRP